MKSLPEAFGEAVRRLRAKTEFSQEAFASHAGISRTYMSEIERGVTNVSLDTISRVAEGLGISLAELFKEVDAASSRRR
ncbi:MAG TPA: helix-turn-helix transcriptional regulator [Gemmatimonadaceae bacterium]|jgi:transcriptional regulator with XRE-family HTH domain